MVVARCRGQQVVRVVTIEVLDLDLGTRVAANEIILTDEIFVHFGCAESIAVVVK